MRNQHASFKALGMWYWIASACKPQFYSNSGAEYNIANGLVPTAQGQSISTLKSFQGDFRILSTKSYTHDEQAKFSPIDYAVSWGMFADPILHVKLRFGSMTAF